MLKKCLKYLPLIIIVAITMALSACGGKDDPDDNGIIACAHEWVRETSDTYLKTPSDCQRAAEWYSHCTLCGAKGITFTDGVIGDHSFAKTAEEKYLHTAAGCEDSAVYYYHCTVCDTLGDTFTYGYPAGHAWDNLATQQTLVSVADCKHASAYYKSCAVCGLISEDTFTLGSPAAHKDTNGDEMCDVCLSAMKNYDEIDTDNRTDIHPFGKEDE